MGRRIPHPLPTLDAFFCRLAAACRRVSLLLLGTVVLSAGLVVVVSARLVVVLPHGIELETPVSSVELFSRPSKQCRSAHNHGPIGQRNLVRSRTDRLHLSPEAIVTHHGEMLAE